MQRADSDNRQPLTPRYKHRMIPQVQPIRLRQLYFHILCDMIYNLVVTGTTRLLIG